MWVAAAAQQRATWASSAACSLPPAREHYIERFYTSSYGVSKSAVRMACAPSLHHEQYCSAAQMAGGAYAARSTWFPAFDQGHHQYIGLQVGGLSCANGTTARLIPPGLLPERCPTQSRWELAGLSDGRQDPHNLSFSAGTLLAAILKRFAYQSVTELPCKCGRIKLSGPLTYELISLESETTY